jgi:hypothetical protein
VIDIDALEKLLSAAEREAAEDAAHPEADPCWETTARNTWCDAVDLHGRSLLAELRELRAERDHYRDLLSAALKVVEVAKDLDEMRVDAHSCLWVRLETALLALDAALEG